MRNGNYKALAALAFALALCAPAPARAAGHDPHAQGEAAAVVYTCPMHPEVKSGTYETVTKLPRGGVYDVAFLLDSPRVMHCFEASAADDPSVEHERATALAVEYLDKEKPLRVGEDFKLRVRLTDRATGEPADGLKDVRVLTFLSPGIWQKRDFARGVGQGVYELNVNVPQPGLYMVFVESLSAGVAFRQLPYLMLRASAPNAAKASAPGQE